MPEETTGTAFPPGFLWGAATAAYQVEGGNQNSDVWAWERVPHTVFHEPAGDACDFYHRFRDDIATLAALGLTAFRFGVEWARVEPEPGEFSTAAFDHYARVLECCLAHGVTPVLTAHHFTSPRWLIARGGWAAPETAERFARYTGELVRRLGDRIGWLCTINELNIPPLIRLAGLMPIHGDRGAQSLVELGAALGVAAPVTFLNADDEAGTEVLLDAHRQGVAAAHAQRAGLPVGVTLSLQQVEAAAGGQQRAERFDERIQRRYLGEAGSVGDFVGVQNYTRVRIGPDGMLPPGENRSDAGLELAPSSLAATCRLAHELTGLPVLVTEHGADLGDAGDDRRAGFVAASLAELAHTIAAGVDVRGYLHWSLLDNFEWTSGYRGRFGLMSVDRATQRRTLRPSATVLARIAAANRA